MRVVVGLISDKKRVLLVRKNSPDWQKGLYNGVGGKVEDDETPLQTMIKNCEAKLGATILNWRILDGKILENGVEILYFLTILDENEIDKLQSQTDERAELFLIKKLPKNILQDLKIQIEKEFLISKKRDIRLSKKTKIAIYITIFIATFLISLMIIGKAQKGDFLYYLTTKNEKEKEDKAVEFIKGFNIKLFGK